MENRISHYAEQAINNNIFPGCVVGFVRKNGERKIFPFGRFAYDQNSPMVKTDTLYDVASITKSIPTASLALQLIDHGKLRVTDKLIDYVPEFNNLDRENVLIKHLLTYGLDAQGFRSEVIEEYRNPEKHLAYIMTHDFEKQSGTLFKYSNIPVFLLGLVVERITGKTLDQIAEEQLFKPLGMNRTTFFPERFSKEEIAPTEIDDWRGIVQGVIHDESAYIFKTYGGKTVGHAGLFSTAGDILTFLEMLLNAGVVAGNRYFSESIINQIETNQIPELDEITGLGWELNQPRFMGKFCGARTFGKTGFTGTLCVVDREKEVAYVILSNRTYPKRPADSATINLFRVQVGEVFLRL